MKLGRMEKVELREAWKNEAEDFTPWLATEENLKLLGDTIGIDLVLHSVEKGVGPFRADIVCKDAAHDTYVLIENQLEKTDHSHLGQVFTYAAGVKAVTIVWIASRFRDEHRSAVDWLNEITKRDFNFFGLEVELWRIGDSEPAPKFNIVSKPNDWTKSQGIGNGQNVDLTATQQLQIEFWGALRERILDTSSVIKPQKPQPQNWTVFGVGRATFNIAAVVNTQKNWARCDLNIYGDDRLAFFHMLHEQKDEIETELGFGLEWRETAANKSSQLRVYLNDVDIKNKEEWPRTLDWMLPTLESLHNAFSKRVRTLNAGDYAEANLEESIEE